MKKLICLCLGILLLAGCAAAYDGPTAEVPRLTEYTVTHYHNFFDWGEERYTDRTVYAYDIYGNRVRSMKYRDDELQTVTNFRYDDRGNEISRTEWDHSGWLPKFGGRSERTYDDQNRELTYTSHDLFGRTIGRSSYTYDDVNHTRTFENDYGDKVVYYCDENGRQLHDISTGAGSTYETVYQYDDRGNQTGWISYRDGVLYDSYEARYDEQDRQIWGGRYDADGTLISQTEYIYDDEQNTKTYLKNDGGKRIEYYHSDGRPHMIEDYDSEGNLSMLQQYYYRDVRVPAKEGEKP